MAGGQILMLAVAMRRSVVEEDERSTPLEAGVDKGSNPVYSLNTYV